MNNIIEERDEDEEETVQAQMGYVRDPEAADDDYSNYEDLPDYDPDAADENNRI